MYEAGIHHVTAIAGPAMRNLDFYTRILGLRLVKKTVNFDDPGIYHFYYGDAAGHPGTILTFFPWERSAPGRVGIGETQETMFRIPEASVGFWLHRFIERGIVHEPVRKRFGETVVLFRGPSRRLPRRRRCDAGGDGGEARRASPHHDDRAEGPAIFSFGLFPRAGWRAVRNRHRYSGLRHR
jgi:catechol 2,3-dioxygenase-like lactoylglutathione lyase family enzyme